MEEISTEVLKNRDETDQGTRSVTPEQLENNESTRKLEKEKPDPRRSQNLATSCLEQGQPISKDASVSEFDENIEKNDFIEQQQLVFTENDAKEAEKELVNCDNAAKTITEPFIVSREDTKIGNEDLLNTKLSEKFEKTSLLISEDGENVAANKTLLDKIDNEQISGNEKIENLEKVECSKVSNSKIEEDMNEEVNSNVPKNYIDEPVSSEAVENREKDLENLNLIDASQLGSTEQYNLGPEYNLDQLETCNACQSEQKVGENLENEEVGEPNSDNFQMVNEGNNAEDITDKQDDYELLTDDSLRGLRSRGRRLPKKVGSRLCSVTQKRYQGRFPVTHGYTKA